MKISKPLILLFVILLIAGFIYYLESLKPKQKELSRSAEITATQPQENADKTKRYERAKELVEPAGYINVEPGFVLSSLVGKKVIMVDFWTYSCINCQRTTPYLNAWYDKYSDQGLEIVGVHTPEFDFEKKYDNVLAAVKKFDIKYPVVLDNDHLTWRAYSNRYWPQKYLIDIDGFIVYEHIGEGGYKETEDKIQELLKERAKRLGKQLKFTDQMLKPETVQQVDFGKVKSPEIYFGSRRNSNLGNGKPYTEGMQVFSRPAAIKKKQAVFKRKMADPAGVRSES